MKTVCVLYALHAAACSKYCTDCIYSTHKPCFLAEHKKTYMDMRAAKTAEQLVHAFKARAKHIRNFVKNEYNLEV